MSFYRIFQGVKKSVTFYRESSSSSSRGRQNFLFTFVVLIPERVTRSQLQAFGLRCSEARPSASLRSESGHNTPDTSFLFFTFWTQKYCLKIPKKFFWSKNVKEKISLRFLVYKIRGNFNWKVQWKIFFKVLSVQNQRKILLKMLKETFSLGF